MNLGARFTLFVRNFIKKYGRKLGIVFGVWVVLFSANQYLKSKNTGNNTLSYTYTPDTPVMSQTSNLAGDDIEEINSAVNKYFAYCNNKDYQSAWNILTDDCKAFLFENNLETFQRYVDSAFEQRKTYNLQNYSNVENTAVYILTYLPDIEKTGTSTGYDTYSERVAFVKDSDRYKLSISNFIRTDKYNTVYEDEYIKATVTSKDISYTRENYKVTIENKTDYFLLIANDSMKNEVTLNLGDEERSAINIGLNEVFVSPKGKENTEFTFTKYFDDGDDPTEIKLNAIRIYEQGNMQPLKVVSSNIKLQK